MEEMILGAYFAFIVTAALFLIAAVIYLIIELIR